MLEYWSNGVRERACSLVRRLLRSLCAFFCLCAAISSSAAPGRTMKLTFGFSRDDIEFGAWKGYDTVRLRGGTLPEDTPGLPWLPAKFVTVWLPSDAEVAGVQAHVLDEILLRADVNLIPVQPPVPVAIPDVRQFTLPDPVAYQSVDRVPAAGFDLSHEGNLRGNRLCSFRLNPLRYVPGRQELYLAGEIVLEVSYETGHRTQSFRGGNDELFRSRVERLAENSSSRAWAEDDSEVSPSGDSDDRSGMLQKRVLAAGSAASNDYLVITSESLTNAFQTLADHRAAHDGFSTEVVTVDWISTNYTGLKPSGGSDIQTRIRECIADYVQNRGTAYVVLGGDNTIVERRKCYVSSGSYTAADIPADLYYAGIDGTWDEDADGVYGEANYSGPDDEGDLYADVMLGRIPVRTAEQAMNYINRLIALETGSQEAAPKKYMLAAHKLWDSYAEDSRPSDLLYDGHAQFRSTAPEHSRVSDGEVWMRRIFRDYVQSSGWEAMPDGIGIMCDTITSWDASTCGDYSAGGQHLVQRLNEEWSFMVMDTHGGNTSWSCEGGFGTADALSLTGRVNLVYTTACLTGAFDQVDPSLSEAFLRNPVGGSLVYLGSSRYNWGSPGSYYGGTGKGFMRDFLELVFDEEVLCVGQAFDAHKEANVGAGASSGSVRWVYFAMNLQGDPAFCITGADKPLKPLVDVREVQVTEGGTNAFNVRLSTQPPGATTVQVSRVEGDADITVTNGASLEFTAADWSEWQTITLSAGEDEDQEHGSTVIACSGPGMPTGTLVAVEYDNDAIGSLEFEHGAFSYTEYVSRKYLPVIRTGGNYGAVTVHYSTMDGTAVAGYDYQQTNGTLSWIDGDFDPKYAVVMTLHDLDPEPDEMFHVNLDSPGGGATLGTVSNMTVTIKANDEHAAPDVSMLMPASEEVFVSETNVCLHLLAGVSDDGLPYGVLNHTWTHQSGAGTVAFLDESATNTTVALSGLGTHVLRMTVSDGHKSAYDELTVQLGVGEVSGETNLAPQVDAGPDIVAEVNAAWGMTGSAGDDGLPVTSSLSVAWSVIAGPGQPLFEDESDPASSCTFPTGGTYVLRLTADDGEVAVCDVTTVAAVQPGPGLVIMETDGATVVAEGATNGDRYYVRLHTQPTQEVSVVIAGGPGQFDISPTNLLFNAVNYSNMQTVSVVAVDDDEIEGLQEWVLGHASLSVDVNYSGATGEVVATIVDNESNAVPIAVDDAAAAQEDGNEILIDVLANDFDDDGHTLTIVSVTNGIGGAAAIGTGGTNISYTSNPDFSGADSFLYTVTDSRGGFGSAVVSVSVAPQYDRFYVDGDASGNGTGDSWSNAFVNLQAALAAATQGDEIWVAEGTYMPTDGTDREASFEVTGGVSLYGGFRGVETSLDDRDWTNHPSVLSGDIGSTGVSTDNCFHVMRTVGGLMLNGFVIQEGYADEWGLDTGRGGGLLVSSGDVPTMIANCRFANNYALENGSALCFANAITLDNCRFHGNRSVTGGGAVSSQGLPLTPTWSTSAASHTANGSYRRAAGPGMLQIRFCSFEANSGGTGGAVSHSGDTEIYKSVFAGNTGGSQGGALSLAGELVLATCDSCVFVTNRSEYWGGAVHYQGHGGKLELINSVFVGNACNGNPAPGIGDGGAVCVRDGDLEFLNCTFTGNHADHGRGAVLDWSWIGLSPPVDLEGQIRNCILWGNTASDGSCIRVEGEDFHLALSHSCLQNGLSSIILTNGAALSVDGLVDTDPLFVADALPSGPDGVWMTADDGIRLRAISPCIDRGLSSTLVLSDILGVARPQGLDIDMGAYERIPDAGDSDNDGLPDWWEEMYGVTEQFNAWGDNDEDGMSDWSEYVAGTAPTSMYSVLKGKVVLPGFPRSLVEFEGTTGRIYQLEFNTNLMFDVWELLPGTSVVPTAAGTYSIDNTNYAPRMFYRVRVGMIE